MKSVETDSYGWWIEMTKHTLTAALSNIKDTVARDINKYAYGRYGLISNPVGHLFFMAFVGSTTYLLGTIVLGSISREFDES